MTGDSGSATDSETGPSTAEGTAPGAADAAVEVFDVLADDTRWAIVRELATYRRDNWRPRGLSFAELRRAVGVADAGRFNYHLNQLRGTLVRKAGGEYVLSNEGFELVGAVLAGGFDATDATRRGGTSEPCPRCDDRLEAIYELGYLRIECPTHGLISGAVVPERPALERPLDDLVRLAGRWCRTHVDYLVDGICPHCWGVVETTVSGEAPDLPGLDPDDDALSTMAFVTTTCRDCGFDSGVPAPVYVVDHPAVVSFRHDHGDATGGMPYLGTALERIAAVALSDETGGRDGEGGPGGTAGGPATLDRIPADVGPGTAAGVVDLAFESERLLVWLADDATVLDAERRPVDGDGAAT